MKVTIETAVNGWLATWPDSGIPALTFHEKAPTRY
jgi:hypothetical protein